MNQHRRPTKVPRTSRTGNQATNPIILVSDNDADDRDLPALVGLDASDHESDDDDSEEDDDTLEPGPNSSIANPTSTRATRPQTSSASATIRPRTVPKGVKSVKPHSVPGPWSDSEEESSCPKVKQQSFATFGWKVLSQEEAAAQNRSDVERMRIESTELKEREERLRAQKKQRTRDLTRERVQRHRERIRKDGTDKGHKAKGKRVKEMVLGYSREDSAAMNVAELSRPGGMSWKRKRNGKKNGVIRGRHSRVNWFHPFLWNHIEDIAPRVGWSATMIARALQRDNPRLFGRLHKGTVQKWLSARGKRWSKRTQLAVEAGHRIAGTGCVGVLTQYPEIVEEIKTVLIGLRTSGICVNRLLGRSVMIAIIEKRKPELLKTFKVTEVCFYNIIAMGWYLLHMQWYVGNFFASVLNWTERKGTRAAAHIPEDAVKRCERTFFRLVHLHNWYDIPPELWINMDQLGLILLLANNTTYHEKGARQVNVVGKDEKRAYTLCVASTASGNILPFQQVWGGKSKLSLPRATAEGMKEAKENGFHFAFAESDKRTSHFSTLKTMKEV